MPGGQGRKGKRRMPLSSDAHFVQARRPGEFQVGAVTDEREQWKKRKASAPQPPLSEVSPCANALCQIILTIVH